MRTKRRVRRSVLVQSFFNPSIQAVELEAWKLLCSVLLVNFTTELKVSVRSGLPKWGSVHSYGTHHSFQRSDFDATSSASNFGAASFQHHDRFKALPTSSSQTIPTFNLSHTHDTPNQLSRWPPT